MKTLVFSTVIACGLLLHVSSISFAVQEDWVEEQSIFNSVLDSNAVNAIKIENINPLQGVSKKAFRSGGSFRPAGHAKPSPSASHQDSDAPKQVPEIAQDNEQQPEGVKAFMARSIREINIDIRESAESFPGDRSQDLVNGDGSDWLYPARTSKTFAWTAPNIRYQPLYFEQVALERYGQTPCGYKEFVATATHFYTSAVMLPLHMRVTPPRSCDHPLGFCRPGSVNPYITEQFWYGNPLRLKQNR